MGPFALQRPCRGWVCQGNRWYVSHSMYAAQSPLPLKHVPDIAAMQLQARVCSISAQYDEVRRGFGVTKQQTDAEESAEGRAGLRCTFCVYTSPRSPPFPLTPPSGASQGCNMPNGVNALTNLRQPTAKHTYTGRQRGRGPSAGPSASAAARQRR